MAESRGVAEEIVSSLAMIFVKNEDRMSSIDAICLVLVAMRCLMLNNLHCKGSKK